MFASVKNELTSDKRVSKFVEAKTSGLDAAISPKHDSRGKRIPVNKSDVESILAHINSYHPVISHYNRKNSPNRRYLDPELTEKLMWEDYITKHEKIGYTTYCSYFKQMNIGFKKPGQDDCQHCAIYEDHLASLNIESDVTAEMKNPIECFKIPIVQQFQHEDLRKRHTEHKFEECEICSNFEKHKTRFIEARKEYQKARDILTTGESIFAVDMQRVILLPKLTTKEHFFISRLVCFNEIFASLTASDPDDTDAAR